MLAYVSYFLLKRGRHLVSFPPRVLVLHSMCAIWWDCELRPTSYTLPEEGNGNKTWVGECIRREETLFKQTLKEMACVKKYLLSACLKEKAGFGNGKAGVKERRAH